MSGPALKYWNSHSSIHEAALGEAVELTELFRQCVERKDTEKSLEVAYIIVEHWEARTLCHADSEEEGLYIDLVQKYPQCKETIIALIRDHNIMRFLVAEIKEILRCKGDFKEILKRLDAIILIDLLHNKDEGKLIRGEMIAIEPGL